MKKTLLSIFVVLGGLITGCTSKPDQQKETSEKEVPPVQPLPVAVPEASDTLSPPEEKKKDRPVTLDFQLHTPLRDIPSGQPLPTDSLSMRAEYAYYPVAAREVQVFITSHASREYDSGETYSLVYYDEKKNRWEPQPTSPIINDVQWVFTPDYPEHRQTIHFFTEENRPGRYRIYKSFNRNTQTAYAEFELITKAQHRRLLDKIVQYHKKHPKTRIAENLNTSGFRENDTLYMDWKIYSEPLMKEFRQKVLDYSAIVVNDGKANATTYFDHPMHTDTLGIKMYTEQEVYPANTESVSVRLVNRSGRKIEMGAWYAVLRKEGSRWIELPGATVWLSLLYNVSSNKIFPFSASLYPSLNSIRPGVYRIVKALKTEGSPYDWYMAAEFRIGNETKPRDSKEMEPVSTPLAPLTENPNKDIAYQVVEEMPEFPGGMPELLAFIKKNLAHDKAGSRQCVYVQFIIDKEGNVTKPIILRGVNPTLDEEALRVVRLMPQWKPGRQDGKAENVKYTIPVIFEPSARKPG